MSQHPAPINSRHKKRRMVPPDPKQQRAARKTLHALFESTDHSRVIHYSCESFYDRTDGASPRITSIAVRKLSDGQTRSFSIHQVAERRGLSGAHLEASYDALERQMLSEFYEYVARLGDVKYLHWNMRDANYGFAAIEHRYRVLGGTPIEIDDSKKVDLSRLLIDIYGNSYMRHRRLESLLDFNGISRLQFLTGQEEAEAFQSHDYVKLHQSTLRKVDVLADIAERADRGILRTYASWWTMHGGRVRSVVDAVSRDSRVLFILALLGGAPTLIGIYAIFQWIITHFVVTPPR
jgi:hypothetical protein